MKNLRYSSFVTAVGVGMVLLMTVGCQQTSVVSTDENLDSDTAAMHLVVSGQYEQAAKQFENSVTARPQDALAHCNVGFIYIDLERYEEAITPLQQAIALEPELAEAHCNLGIACIGLDRLPEATGHLEEAIRLKPDYAEAQAKLGMAWMLRREWSKAVEPLEQAVRLNPDSAAAHFTLGAAYAKLGNPHAALKQHEILKTLDPAMAGRYLQEYKKQEQLMANMTQ